MRITKSQAVHISESVIPGIFAAAFITLYTVKSQGLATLVTFGAAMAVSYVLYLLTSFRNTPAPEKVLSLYLLAVGIELIHFIEEYVTRFYVRFPVEIYHSAPFGENEFFISQMILFSLLVFAAIGVYKRWKIPMIMVWFLIVMLLIVNAVQHPIYALMVGGYFPGLFTSVPGWILGPLLFKRMWEAGRHF